MRLYEYVLRRIILMVFVLVGVSLIVFYLGRGLLPPESALAPYITPRMDDATKLQLARSLGVATSSCPSWSALAAHESVCLVPVWGQYLSWVGNVLAGNWGYSLLPGVAGTQTTWDVFWLRFPYTAELAVAGTILTALVAIPLGIISATRNNRLPDHVSRFISLGGYSVPAFWFGLLLQLLFVLYLRVGGNALLPSNGVLDTSCALCVSSPGQVTGYTGAPILDALLSLNPVYFWDSLVALFLPTLTLAITSIGALTRILRSSMMEVLRQDYILLARSKGLKERVVIYRHALKNAVLPSITITGLLFALLLGGVVIVEVVFSWPGVGAASVVASTVLDVNFLELYVLVTAFIIVVTNLLVDIVYAKLDPRIRY